MHYHIEPLRRDFLIKVREFAIDDQNQPIVRLAARGGEPCRDVLRRAYPGEALILASYCPFSKPGPFKEYGAVYVLATPSEEVVNYATFPLENNSKCAYFGDSLVLRAYDKEEYIYDARLVNFDQAEQTINEFFSDEKVEFILARFTAYGCYSLRLDRQ